MTAFAHVVTDVPVRIHREWPHVLSKLKKRATSPRDARRVGEFGEAHEPIEPSQEHAADLEGQDQGGHRQGHR